MCCYTYKRACYAPLWGLCKATTLVLCALLQFRAWDKEWSTAPSALLCSRPERVNPRPTTQAPVPCLHAPSLSCPAHSLPHAPSMLAYLCTRRIRTNLAPPPHASLLCSLHTCPYLLPCQLTMSSTSSTTLSSGPKLAPIRPSSQHTQLPLLLAHGRQHCAHCLGLAQSSYAGAMFLGSPLHSGSPLCKGQPRSTAPAWLLCARPMRVFCRGYLANTQALRHSLPSPPPSGVFACPFVCCPTHTASHVTSLPLPSGAPPHPPCQMHPACWRPFAPG